MLFLVFFLLGVYASAADSQSPTALTATAQKVTEHDADDPVLSALE